MTDKKNKVAGINHLAAEAQKNREMENAKQARTEAEKDLVDDAEFTAHNANEDLDEEESAKLGENNNGLV
jgi:hypothetical protein